MISFGLLLCGSIFLEDDDDGSVGDDDDRRRASATDLAWRVVWCGVMWLVLLLEMV